MKQADLLEHQSRCEEIKGKIKAGPWTYESDRLAWKHAGLDCMIIRNPALLNLCGYVGVPKGHPAYGKNYNALEVEVHGGLTYASECDGHICHVTEGNDDVFWFGFDCAHSGDLVPGMLAIDEMYGLKSRGTYKDISYVRREINKLARQLAKLNKSGF